MKNNKIVLDHSRDERLTGFGKKTLEDRYLLKGETYQEMFARVATAFQGNDDHGARMYSYLSSLWFLGATPVLSNGGTDRGKAISCFLNSVPDDMQGIAAKWDENVWLGSGGGGTGTNFSNVRGIGAPVAKRGKSSGIIPFIGVVDRLTLAVSQGSLRRGAGAVYLHASHPEIEEFLEIRRPTGDINRKALNLHHGVIIPDALWYAVEKNLDWYLIDPHTKQVTSTLNAREFMQRILTCRMETGEPYLIFEGNVQRGIPRIYSELELCPTQSNLCSEIFLHTGIDYLGKDRTAVCCLGSANIEYYDEWKDNPLFVKDCLLFLDNVIQSFIDQTDGVHGYENARYAAIRERAVGLGVMGFHSYLMKNKKPFGCLWSKVTNLEIFRHLSDSCKSANEELALEKGACPDSLYLRDLEIHKGIPEELQTPLVRMTHCMAIAPTASISIIAANTSPCVEPLDSNYFTQKTLSGVDGIKNKFLEERLVELGMDDEETWNSILVHEGSVQHLPFLTDDDKELFMTAFEIDQRWIVEYGGDRSPSIDQGASNNLFVESDIHKFELLMLHYSAWKRGVKSLYYLRTRATRRASVVGSVSDDNTMERTKIPINYRRDDYVECLACQ
jgi:ribonucleoside-diphosphate reductase alpha chain